MKTVFRAFCLAHSESVLKLVQAIKSTFFCFLVPMFLVGIFGCAWSPLEKSDERKQENENDEPIQRLADEDMRKKYPPYNEFQGWFNIPSEPSEKPGGYGYHQTEAHVPPLHDKEVSEMNEAVHECIRVNCIRLGWTEEDFRNNDIRRHKMEDFDIDDRTIPTIVPTPEHLTKELFLDLQRLIRKNPLWRVMVRANEKPYLIYPDVIYILDDEALNLESQLEAAVQMEIALVEPEEGVFRRKAAYMSAEIRKKSPIMPGQWRIFVFDNFRGDPEWIEVWLFSNNEDYIRVRQPEPDMVSTTGAMKDGRIGIIYLRNKEYDVTIYIYRRPNFDKRIVVGKLVKPGKPPEFEETEYIIDRVITDRELIPLDPGRSNKAAMHY
jgi:hypothetical protein